MIAASRGRASRQVTASRRRKGLGAYTLQPFRHGDVGFEPDGSPFVVWDVYTRRPDVDPDQQGGVVIVPQNATEEGQCARLAYFAVIAPDSDGQDVDVDRASPDGGVTRNPAEVAWRFLGSEKAGTWTVGDPVPVLLVEGVPLILE